MMKSERAPKSNSLVRHVRSIRPHEFQAAADTLEKLQHHNFEVSSMHSAAIARHICDHSKDFTHVCDTGLQRLHYKRPVSGIEKTLVEEMAGQLFEQARLYTGQIIEEQLCVLGHVSRSVRGLRNGVSLSFAPCIQALCSTLILSLEEESREKFILQKDKEGVREIIRLFRELGSELDSGGLVHVSKPVPATDVLKSSSKHRLRMPAVPGSKRASTHKPDASKQLAAEKKIAICSANTETPTSMFSSVSSAEDLAFFHECLRTDFGVKQSIADELAPLYSVDAICNLVQAFEGVARSLRVQLGNRYPQIFNPRGEENWSTYAQLLAQATELAGGVDQVRQYLGRMENSRTLKALVKELKRRA